MFAAIGAFIADYLIAGIFLALFTDLDEATTRGEKIFILFIRTLLWFPAIILGILFIPFDLYRDWRIRRDGKTRQRPWEETL